MQTNFLYKTRRLGKSASQHSTFMYCIERKKFIDRLFERSIEKGDDVFAIVKYIIRQYEFRFGKDKFHEQLENIVWRKLNRRKEREYDQRDELFDFLFKETKYLFSIQLKTTAGKEKQFEYIKKGLIEKFGDTDDLEQYIKDNIKRYINNLTARLKLAVRKGELNYFNYFVTFTYDSKKHTADSFEEQLKTKLKNEAYRRGWAYMGIKEHGSKTERRHFHYLMYIPDKQMIGKLYETSKFCKIKKCRKKFIENSEFKKLFGQNDFERITYTHGTKTPVEYIQKYMSKTDEKIQYSRHLPSYKFTSLPDVETDADEATPELDRIDIIRKVRCNECQNCKDGKRCTSPKDWIKGYMLTVDDTDTHIPIITPGRYGSVSWRNRKLGDTG